MGGCLGTKNAAVSHCKQVEVARVRVMTLEARLETQIDCAFVTRGSAACGRYFRAADATKIRLRIAKEQLNAVLDDFEAPAHIFAIRRAVRRDTPLFPHQSSADATRQTPIVVVRPVPTTAQDVLPPYSTMDCPPPYMHTSLA